MKPIIFWILILCSSSLSAQSNLGKEWYIGLRNYKINFSTLTPIVSYLNDADSMPKIAVGNSNICDSEGHLILATDGIKLYNRLGGYIDGGGENINNDTITWKDGFDTAYPNTSIVLPKGNQQYYVFISTMSDPKYSKYFWNNDTFDFDEVRYSVVDMAANNGQGKILEKNKLLLHVNAYPWLNKSNFTACRHANGRDWWLLKPSARMRQVMYKFLVTESGIETFTENLPILFSPWAYDNVGQSCFSKDGNLYAECNNNGPHTIYNFDRCSGELSLKRLFNGFPYKDTFGSWIDKANKWRGLCFSPNNRFLYTCDAFNIYQIDLWESDDSKSIRRVSKDTNSNPLPYGFPQYSCMQLTPTGVIYLGNWHGISPNINGILYPDKLGDSCGFTFGYVKSIYNTNDPPNMPFYELGALAGSPCDSLHPPIVPIPASEEVIAVPNAFSPNADGLNDTWHILNIPYLQQEGISLQEVGIYTRWGKCVFKSNALNFAWEAKDWASDTYYYYLRYRNKSGNLQVQKGSVSLIR